MFRGTEPEGETSMDEVDGPGSDGDGQTAEAKRPAAWAPGAWMQRTVGEMLRGEEERPPGKKEPRRGTTSEAHGSRSRTPWRMWRWEPAATEEQWAWTQGTVGVMLRGEEGDVGAGCGGV